MTAIQNTSFCVLEVKKYDYYRYLCCLLAPEEQRDKLFTIYAFNNEIAKIKDMVTEPMAGHIRLQWWREAIDEIYKKKPVSHKHEVVDALYELVHGSKIPKSMFHNLINAREADIEFHAPANMEDIKQYTINTSSNLFYLILAALEIDDKQAKEAAYYSGIAYAMTGIMRSMRHNSYHRRVMLPKDMMEEQQITTKEIIEGKNLEKTRTIVRALCEHAKVSLNHVAALSGEIPKEAKIALLPLSTVDIFLNRIKRHNYDLFNSNIEHGRLGVQMRILKGRLLGKV